MIMLTAQARPYPNTLRRWYAPFLGLAEHCHGVYGTVLGSFSVGERRYTVPRFSLLGLPGNGPQVRLGLFGLLHGDEPAGTLALAQLLRTLVDDPELARGYDLHVYPVCNPTGCEDQTRHNRAGFDLNREFWQGSHQPEVQILEKELREQSLDGLIALHADDTSEGLYGYSLGRVINEHLLVPALRASERILPRNRGSLIDGFSAREGVICDCYTGILAPPPEQRPRPFEIIFETPALARMEDQVAAAHAALLCILEEYRGFIAQAENL